MYILHKKLAKQICFSVLFGIMCLCACTNETKQPPTAIEAEVILETDKGPIGLILYQETPLHRENFLKLARSGFFDSLMFHRIILNFMVQSGDPSTRPSQSGGANGPGYTLPAEIMDTFVHTKGKLAAARLPDEENPERRSAGSQFYIVTGKVPTPQILDSMANERTNVYRGIYYQQYAQLSDSAKAQQSFQDYLEKSDFQPYQYRAKDRELYLSEGGTPHLDFTYTIFGEVVFGMEVVRQIEIGLTNDYNQPQIPVRIQSVRIVADEK